MGKSIIATSEYVSIIGVNWIKPIVALWQELNELPPKKPNEVQTGAFENGHSVAIVAMATFMVESYLNRLKYVLKERNELDKKLAESKPVDTFRKVCSDSVLADGLEEIFVARDVVVHNHLWDGEICWTDDGLEFVGKPKHNGRPLSGDKKFEKVINRETRKTQRLGINLFPLRIWREDAVKCLSVACDVLLHLEGKDRNFCDISQLHVMYYGKPVSLVAFMHNPGTCRNKPDDLPEAELGS